MGMKASDLLLPHIFLNILFQIAMAALLMILETEVIVSLLALNSKQG
jgi:hypothetical protein